MYFHVITHMLVYTMFVNQYQTTGDVMDLLRILAAIIAFSVCTFEGYRRSRELKDHMEFLEETSLLLERFSIGIRCSGETSDELLESEHGHFARLVKTHKAECGNTRNAWEKACGALPKKNAETALLRELGRSFGASDKESTLRLLERCKAELLALKTAAEADYSKRGKAFFQVGTLCGIGAAVLMI